MTTNFQLHTKLQDDCLEVGDLKLCKLLLMNDSQFPWLILVPKVDARESYQLSKDDQISLVLESNLIAKTMQQLFNPDKLNIATIGNIVPQLHMHIVARYKNDPVWPAPVWGALPAVRYTEDQEAEMLLKLRTSLSRYVRKSESPASPPN